MTKTNSLKRVHRHTLAIIAVVGLVCIWSFVIYPKIALGIDAPTGLRATAGNEEVVLTWTDPTLDEVPDIDPPASYRIYYHEIGKFDITTIDTPSSPTEYTVTRLTNDVEYVFTVSAINAEETESDQSDEVNATPTARGEEIELVREPAVETTETTATITWDTNIEASSQIAYGPTEDFSGNTEEYNVARRTTSHSVELTGLTSCAGYWYKVSSRDAEENLVQSSGGEFKTGGCKGGSEILAYTARKIERESSATLSVTNSGRVIDVVVPVNLKTGVDAVAVEAIKLEKELVRGEISTPSSKQWIGNAYSLKVFENENTELNDSFDAPVSVTISYLADDIDGIDPDTLKIYHYEDATGWRQLSNCSVDQSARTVTCETTSFSIFGLFGSEQSSGGQVTSSGTYPKPTSIENVPTVITPENNSIPTEPIQPIVPTEPNTSIKNNFQKNLGFGSRDSDVKNLQSLLNKLGFVVAVSGPGSLGHETDYFGPLTFAALVKFQEVYKEQILTPLGLSKGTGFFGEKTRAFINLMQ